MMRGSHTPRSLENMSKKKRLLAVASDLGPGSCSAAMTEGRGGGWEVSLKKGVAASGACATARLHNHASHITVFED